METTTTNAGRAIHDAVRMAGHAARHACHRTATVLIIDDHPLIREGLAARVASQPDLAVCGEVSTISGALAVLEAETPDLAIVDLVLQDGHGLDLIKSIARKGYPTKVLVISAYDESIYAERVLRAGAQGYVNKRELHGSILDAIRAVLRGDRFLSPEITNRLVRQALGGHRERGVSAEILTDRELMVFEMIGRGLSTRRIASRLNLSVHTVESHREKIRHKLDLNDGTELMRRAVEWVLEQAS